MKSPVHVTGTGEIILERSVEFIRGLDGISEGVPSKTNIYYSNEEEGNVAHVELKPGKYCNECCFGDVEEGLGGTVQCLKQGKKKCKPGKTVYKEIYNLPAMTNADKIRDMTDEELATFLVLNALQREHWDCAKELEWLRLEAKEEE